MFSKKDITFKSPFYQDGRRDKVKWVQLAVLVIVWKRYWLAAHVKAILALSIAFVFHRLVSHKYVLFYGFMFVGLKDMLLEAGVRQIMTILLL